MQTTSPKTKPFLVTKCGYTFIGCDRAQMALCTFWSAVAGYKPRGRGLVNRNSTTKGVIINPRRACAARVTVVVLSVCLSVRASSRTTGYEAANEWHQRVVNNEKIDIMWRFPRNDCVPEIWRENKRKSLRERSMARTFERSIAHARMWVTPFAGECDATWLF